MFAIFADNGEKYVSLGDKTNPDYDKTTLTVDNQYHDLDLSGLCPAGTKRIRIRILAVWPSAGFAAFLRKKGYVNEINIGRYLAEIANSQIDIVRNIECNTDRFIEYRINTSVTNIYFCILGYYIE